MSADMWAQADPDASGEDLPLDPPAADGKYTVMLVEGYAGIGKTSNNAFVALTLEAVDGQPGYRWKVLGGFKSQGQANMTKKMVRDLGVNVDVPFSEVVEALKLKAGEYFHVTVKTNGEFRNTYVDGPAQAGAQSDLGEPSFPPPTAVPTPAGADDDIPF